MKRTATTAVFLVMLLANIEAQYGKYIGTIVARFEPDGRTMVLIEPFAYIDPLNLRWDAPVGARIDGASIPQFAWSFIGGPFEGKYRDASVLHDVACVERKRFWWLVHDMFYTGMLASGVDTAKAKVMYAAVYHFGPRWRAPSQAEESPEITSLEVASAGRCLPGRSTICASSAEEALALRDHLGTPLPQTLTAADFNRLASEILQRETSAAGGMPLEQIRQFR